MGLSRVTSSAVLQPRLEPVAAVPKPEPRGPASRGMREAAAPASAPASLRGAAHALIVLLVIGLFLRVSRDEEAWQTAVLGIGLIPFLTDLTCYYYSIYIGYALLLPRSPSTVTGLFIYSSISWVPLFVVADAGQRYALLSLMVLAFALFATCKLALKPTGEG